MIAQILSIISCVAIIFSFQFKNNRNLFIIQTLAALGFGISYLLLGAYDGFVMNLISFVNTYVLLLNKKYRIKPILIAICIGFIASPIISLITFNGIWTTRVIIKTIAAFLVAMAQIAKVFSMWKDDGKLIRIVQIFVASPAWLFYNVSVFSLGGIICESFNIISIIISFIRYGKDGFEK